MIAYYMNKARHMAGGTRAMPAREAAWAWCGGWLVILGLFGMETLLPQDWNIPLLFGPFGASAVLLFGAPHSPLARPRNVVGGHVLSALVGVTAFQMFGSNPLIASGMAVSTAIALMRLTGTLHPPGGATALIAVVGGEGIHSLGFGYALLPCGAGAAFMTLMALLFGSLSGVRRSAQSEK